jgi:branched-chain amino acid transport system ATP-binding protein
MSCCKSRPGQGLRRRQGGGRHPLRAAAGELLALIGPNGAGKSTTFNMVNGQLAADTGSIVLDGHDLVGCRRATSGAWAWAAPSRSPTFASLTVVENVQMALLSATTACFDVAPARRTKRAEALDLLDRWAWPQADRPCSVLAYGDKRVELAMAMANSPLLLMDEPTAGMAPKERNELMALTKRWWSSAAWPCCSPSTAWTWCSPTPTAWSCWRAGA